MVEQIINSINQTLNLPDGSKIMGVAESVLKNSAGVNEYSPWLVDKHGEGKYAGFDNTLPISLYHKISDVVISTGRNGLGDDLGDLINTYNCSCIVYINRNKSKITPLELALTLQNQFPTGMKFAPYKNIVIRFLRVILNSMQIWTTEYQGIEFNLPSDSNLFAINYQIESTFKKGCFINC